MRFSENMSKLDDLKELVFSSDDKACFIERERILSRLGREMSNYNEKDRYALILSKLLSEVSTPILDCDYFAGRVVEALPDEGMNAPSRLISSSGHMNFDYEKVLAVGLRGILDEIKKKAEIKGDSDSLSFAKNAEIVVNAVRNFALRYSEKAREKGFDEMARALEKVPFEGAYDFYSALQSVWILHMIASCYVGSRDYAFGRFDEYMLPFYEKALEDGKSREELTELLAGFFIKTNEICGRCTHNHEVKPILSPASKQYVNIGGEEPSEFSSIVLDAAKMCNMAQPQIVVLLKADADAEFTRNAFEALAVLNDKMNIYNYDLVKNVLLSKGFDENIAKNFTYSACCTFDLNFHTIRREYFAPVPQIFLRTLASGEYGSVEDILASFKEELRKDIQVYVDKTQMSLNEDFARRLFVFDSMLLSDSAVECRYPCDGGSKYNVMNVFCPAVATVGDSLMVLDKLVFNEKRYTYKEFIGIIENDFEGNEALRAEILSYTKFGNDSEADKYAARAGKTFIEATDEVVLKDNFNIAAGFYSLERDNTWKAQIGATPDGRKNGDPFSENQSPTYGADKKGITALLSSVAKLPLDKTVTGGLNIAFAQNINADILQTLIVTYFKKGGLHVGVSIINRATLQDAMINPDRYKSLTVRLYGFSEYFISLPKWQQLAILNRTVN